MSCAQFPPDWKLCFMAASSGSIPSAQSFPACFSTQESHKVQAAAGPFLAFRPSQPTFTQRMLPNKPAAVIPAASAATALHLCSAVGQLLELSGRSPDLLAGCRGVAEWTTRRSLVSVVKCFLLSSPVVVFFSKHKNRNWEMLYTWLSALFCLGDSISHKSAVRADLWVFIAISVPSYSRLWI